jgi:hypothetical protein
LVEKLLESELVKVVDVDTEPPISATSGIVNVAPNLTLTPIEDAPSGDDKGQQGKVQEEERNLRSTVHDALFENPWENVIDIVPLVPSSFPDTFALEDVHCGLPTRISATLTINDITTDQREPQGWTLYPHTGQLIFPDTNGIVEMRNESSGRYIRL